MSKKENLTLEATQLDNKVNCLQKKKIGIDSFFCFNGKHREFIKKSKSILESQRRFRSEKHNVFTGEINVIAEAQMMMK